MAVEPPIAVRTVPDASTERPRFAARAIAERCTRVARPLKPLAFLLIALLIALGARPVVACQRDLAAALSEFEELISSRWSYREANDADFKSAIDALRTRVAKGIDAKDFAIELQKIVALGIDGHAEVDGFRLGSREFLPFLVEPVGDRFVAFAPDRSRFLADGYPYVTSIDGKDVAEWIAIAREYAPKGSPQYVRRHALRTLRDLGHLRERLGLKTGQPVVVELAAAPGRKTHTVELAPRNSPPTYGVWPRGGSRLIDGAVGYLRLPDMDAESSVREIDEWMPKFEKTKGLVIDVRDNGGGARDALLRLYSILAKQGDPPRVINCAAYRLHRSRDEDHLARRYLYRAGDSRWSKEERAAIASFAKEFRPKWELPAGKFSDWHYLVLSRAPEAKSYAKPVVVLLNAKCYSATDIFLAGMKAIPGVTLMGESSGGGSAMVEKFDLADSGLSVVLGSMASFQADGQLFDGVGVTPHVVVEPSPEYFIGGADVVLDAAIARIRKK